MSQYFITKTGILLILALLCYRRFLRKKEKLGLPPGPKRWPMVGNVTDLPPNEFPDFLHWQKYNEIYGPITSMSVLNQTFIITHDREATHDLLAKKSLRTSSRPLLEFSHNLCGYDNLLPLQPYDHKYRRRRKIIDREIGTQTKVTQFQDIQEVESRRLILRMLNRPEDSLVHTKTLATALMAKILYGYSVGPTGTDPLVLTVGHMLDNILAALMPMDWLVDAIPALKYLPDGFPGTAFKEKARQWHKTNQDMANMPYSFVQQQMEKNDYCPSYVSKLLAQKSKKPAQEDEDDVKWTAATLNAAGTVTIWSTLNSFILAMVMFPEVQCKAQEEIDRVTGAHRLPTFDDRKDMPYVNNLVTEVYRWFAVAPMGVPHKAEDDIPYNGYLIPKGAYILPAIWWFCHDPEVYRDPDSFDPDRYLEPRKEPDSRTVVFGFGRRLCPGRYLADSTVFICIAKILAGFTISKAVDERGVEIEVRVEPTPSVNSQPKKFSYEIRPRTTRYREIIGGVEAK
ncbi:cytochrome P450 [Mariannaea sp. PMI_226]|nr:cytochrome P450 [Mariannaea sp. PMI_226]